jgi:putative peptide zinc metalloprotease protein
VSAPTALRHVRLHELTLRDEGEEWIVGRVATGKFVALPPIGARVIRLLQADPDVAAASVVINAEADEPVDIPAFLQALTRLGFVDEVDGVPVGAAKAVPKSSFPGVRPEQVRWLLHPLLGLAVLAILLSGLVLIALRPGVVPAPSDVVWSEHGSLVILAQLVMAWSVIFLHELAHLFTARAAGVPGRISLGTRLQFLVAQTDVSGVWSAPRNVRLVVYLSGMALNAVLAVAGLFLNLLATTPGLHNLAAVLFTTQVVFLAGQFAFFMRTDVYFVAQDLARCRNLFGDATALVRYTLRRLTGRRRGETDPSAALPKRERTAVRAYAVFFVPATVICVGVFLGVTLPVTFHLAAQATGNLRDATGPRMVIDAVVVLAVIAGAQLLWAWAWWRRHGTRIRAALSGRR